MSTVRLLIVATLLCANALHAETAPRSKDEWQEEILLQLSEMRKSQGQLAEQVKQLQAEVQQLRSAPQPVAQQARPTAAVPVAIDLSTPNLVSMGKSKSNIAIVEFSDFQCPFCRRYHENTWPTIKEKYVDAGKLNYVFANFPLSGHPNAEPAAVAAACAEKQGKFWPMHSALFESQRDLTDARFKQVAADLKLNADTFASCLLDKKMVEAIRLHSAIGDQAGVRGTPAFLIGRVKNGKLVDAVTVSGAQPLAAFERAIEQVMAGSKS